MHKPSIFHQWLTRIKQSFVVTKIYAVQHKNGYTGRMREAHRPRHARIGGAQRGADSKCPQNSCIRIERQNLGILKRPDLNLGVLFFVAFLRHIEILDAIDERQS